MNYLNRFKAAYKRKGIFYALRVSVLSIYLSLKDNIVSFYYSYLYFGQKSFEYDGKNYRYLFHPLNTTWLNARAVEIPIFIDIINTHTKSKILEIGNVLNHYIDHSHDVLDLYEQYPGVTNEDAAYFIPNSKYDLIISISTMEHIGRDDESQNSAKALTAINNILNNMLNPSGIFIFSIPLGYNIDLDKYLTSSKPELIKTLCLRKLANVEWKEIELADAAASISDAKYGWNGDSPTILIGYLKKQVN